MFPSEKFKYPAKQHKDDRKLLDTWKRETGLYLSNSMKDLYGFTRRIHVKTLVSQGIPRAVRADAWLHYSGAANLLADNESLFEVLTFREEQDSHGHNQQEILKHIQSIDSDIHRTFPRNMHFKRNTLHPDDINHQSQYVQSLRRILVAFVYYSWPHSDTRRNPPAIAPYNIGYCQGMNEIVALLLLVFAYGTGFEIDEADAIKVEAKVFWMLAAIVNLLPNETYGVTLVGASITQNVLWDFIAGPNSRVSGLYKVSSKLMQLENSQHHCGSRMPSLHSITMHWFMTLFINVLRTDVVLKLWDLMFFSKSIENIFFQVVLAMIKKNEKELLRIEEPILIWKFIKDLPNKLNEQDAAHLQDVDSRYPLHHLP